MISKIFLLKLYLYAAKIIEATSVNKGKRGFIGKNNYSQTILKRMIGLNSKKKMINFLFFYKCMLKER